MPIVFEAPQPLSPSISTGYGAATTWQQDAPLLQRQQQGIAEAYLQSAGLQQRAAQASQQMQLQAHEHMAGLDQQQANQQAHFALAQQQMGHQSDMQAQHASLQDQLAQNQLTRGETLRLQRLQEARADIQMRIQSGTMTQEDGDNALMQVTTGINQYQLRQQRAQAAGAEVHNQLMQRQVAQIDNLQRERDEFNTQGLDARTRTRIDDNGNERSVIMGRNGDIDWHATALIFGHQYGGGEHSASGRGAGGGTGGGTGGGAGGGDTNATAARGLYGRTWEQLTHQERQHITDRIEDSMRREETRPAGEAGVGWTRPAWAANDTTRATRFRALRDAAMLNHAAPPNQQQTPEQQAAQIQVGDDAARAAAVREFNLANRERIHNATPAQRAVIAQERVAAGTMSVLQRQLQRQNVGNVGTVAPTPLRQHASDEEREASSSTAFTPQELEAMPTQAIRSSATRLNEFRSRLPAANVAAPRRRELTTYLNDAQQILTEFGTVAAMPLSSRRRYDHALAVLSRTPEPRQQQQRSEEGMLDTLFRAPGRVGRAANDLIYQLDPEGGYNRSPRQEE